MEQLHLCPQSLAAPSIPQQQPVLKPHGHWGSSSAQLDSPSPAPSSSHMCHRAMGFAVLMTGIIPHGLAHGPALLRLYSGRVAQKDQEPCRAEAAQSSLRTWAWLPFGMSEAVTMEKTFTQRGSHSPLWLLPGSLITGSSRLFFLPSQGGESYTLGT